MADIGATDIGFSTGDVGTSIDPSAIGNTAVVMVANITGTVKARLIPIVATSLLFVGGLSWNNFFNALINYYIPEKYRKAYSGWIKLAYALALTSLIILIISAMAYYMPSNEKIVAKS
jgi:hypothetical protein